MGGEFDVSNTPTVGYSRLIDPSIVINGFSQSLAYVSRFINETSAYFLADYALLSAPELAQKCIEKQFSHSPALLQAALKMLKVVDFNTPEFKQLVTDVFISSELTSTIVKGAAVAIPAAVAVGYVTGLMNDAMKSEEQKAEKTGLVAALPGPLTTGIFVAGSLAATEYIKQELPEYVANTVSTSVFSNLLERIQGAVGMTVSSVLDLTSRSFYQRAGEVLTESMKDLITSDNNYKNLMLAAPVIFAACLGAGYVAANYRSTPKVSESRSSFFASEGKPQPPDDLEQGYSPSMDLLD